MYSDKIFPPCSTTCLLFQTKVNDYLQNWRFMKGNHSWGGFPWPPNEFFIVLKPLLSVWLCWLDREDVLWLLKGSVLWMNYGWVLYAHALHCSLWHVLWVSSLVSSWFQSNRPFWFENLKESAVSRNAHIICRQIRQSFGRKLNSWKPSSMSKEMCRKKDKFRTVFRIFKFPNVDKNNKNKNTRGIICFSCIKQFNALYYVHISNLQNMHNVKISEIYLPLILCHSPYYIQSKTIFNQFLNRIRTANISQQRPTKQFTQYIDIIKLKKEKQ